MAVELVLLTDTAPTPEDWASAAAAVIAGGDLHDLLDGSYLMRDDRNEGILTWWPPRPLLACREAARMTEGAGSHAVWTDVALPYVASAPGRAICAELARRLGGRVVERK